MLLEFRTQNYKSFVEEAIFTLIPAPKQKGLDYSLLKENIKGKKIKALASSVIYGPNATGKTNIIGAMDVMRAIVLRGNIRNYDEHSLPNDAVALLELIPNKELQTPQPVTFSIEFIEAGLLIKYLIKIDLGTFLDEDYKRKILLEELSVNGNEIFSRGNELKLGNISILKDYLFESTEKNNNSAIEFSKNSLVDDELFLTNGFKLIYSQKLVKLIYDWFKDKFMVIYHANSMQLIKKFADPQKKTVYIEKTTNEAAKLFGINSNAVGYVVGEDNSEPKLCSILKNIKTRNDIALNAELFESYGTIRFIHLFPLIIRAMQTGGTLVIDEFDASIHPMALMSIVNIFHNDEININHAQLIFNTHNPIFLNSNIFRRDEIKFVDRDDETHYSTLYSLSDFRTSGKNGVRGNEDYMKNYFIDKYGAIKEIDFTPVFEQLLNDGEEI